MLIRGWVGLCAFCNRLSPSTTIKYATYASTAPPQQTRQHMGTHNLTYNIARVIIFKGKPGWADHCKSQETNFPICFHFFPFFFFSEHFVSYSPYVELKKKQTLYLWFFFLVSTKNWKLILINVLKPGKETWGEWDQNPPTFGSWVLHHSLTIPDVIDFIVCCTFQKRRETFKIG